MQKPKPKLVSQNGQRQAGKLCACGCDKELPSFRLSVVHFPADGTPALWVATTACQAKVAAGLKKNGQDYLCLS